MSSIPSIFNQYPKEEAQRNSLPTYQKNEQIKIVQEVLDKHLNLTPNRCPSEDAVKKIQASNDEDKQNLESRIDNESYNKSEKLTESNTMEFIDPEEPFKPRSWNDFLSAPKPSSSKKKRAERSFSSSKKRRIKEEASPEENAVPFNIKPLINQDESYKDKLSFTPGPGDCSLEDEDLLSRLERPWQK